MGYYAIKLISEPYTIQKGKMCDGQVTTAFKLDVISQYKTTRSGIGNINQNIKINLFLHAQFHIHAWMPPPSPKIKTKSICRKKSHKANQMRPICLTESDSHLYSLESK